MFRHIFVPLDGSARAEQVLPVAAHLARASHGTITLLQVVDLARDAISYGMGAPYITHDLIESELSCSKSYLKRLSHSPSLVGIEVQTQTIPGNPAAEIIAHTADPSIDLVVIASHGYTGMKRWFLGSVAEKVAQHSVAPVLILRDGTASNIWCREDAASNIRALVPLDTSPRSLDVLAPVAELVTALSDSHQGELHLAQMVVARERSSTSEQEKLLTIAAQNLASITQNIRDGLVTRFCSDLHPALSSFVLLTDDIAEGIVRAAETGKETPGTGEAKAYDLIALTTHGFGGLCFWPVGSIAEHVLHTTHLPVLIVRPEDMLVKERKSYRHSVEATV